jgi:peptidoglycan hydrolase CwlO-like protein
MKALLSTHNLIKSEQTNLISSLLNLEKKLDTLDIGFRKINCQLDDLDEKLTCVQTVMEELLFYIAEKETNSVEDIKIFSQPNNPNKSELN